MTKKKDQTKDVQRYVPWDHVTEMCDFMDSLIHGSTDVKSVCCADVGTFIWNEGTVDDQVDALFVLLPIAKRVFGLIEKRRSDARNHIANKGGD